MYERELINYMDISLRLGDVKIQGVLKGNLPVHVTPAIPTGGLIASGTVQPPT